MIGLAPRLLDIKGSCVADALDEAGSLFGLGLVKHDHCSSLGWTGALDGRIGAKSSRT